MPSLQDDAAVTAARRHVTAVQRRGTATPSPRYGRPSPRPSRGRHAAWLIDDLGGVCQAGESVTCDAQRRLRLCEPV